MSVSDAVRKRVRQAANNCCGYCRISGSHVYAPMEMDHLHPISAGGTDDEENLWVACPWCNGFKSDQLSFIDPTTNQDVALFNPRKQIWHEHFAWDASDKAIIVGLTPCGRATVAALRLNNGDGLAFRRLLVSVGWYPPPQQASQ